MVHYYSNKKDPIHHYFKEKYEIVSSTKEALKIMKSHDTDNNENHTPPENRTTVFKKIIKGFELIPEEPHEIDMKSSLNAYLPSNRYSFSKKKKVRQEKLKMLQEIQKKKKEEVMDMSKLMINFLENSKKNDTIISEDLKKQIDSILAKANQKKMNSTMNNSGSNSFRFMGNEPSEISSFMNFSMFYLMFFCNRNC